MSLQNPVSIYKLVRIVIKTPRMSSAEWNIFQNNVIPFLRKNGFQFDRANKYWYKIVESGKEDTIMYSVNKLYTDLKIPPPEISKDVVKEGGAEESRVSPTGEIQPKEIKQETIVPKPEPPVSFYIIANQENFQIVGEEPTLIGNFKLYPSDDDSVGDDLLKQIKEGQFLVKIRRWKQVGKEPDGDFIFKPYGGPSFDIFWKKQLAKLKKKYLPVYLKKRLKKEKVKALQKFHEIEKGAGEWFYEGEICYIRNYSLEAVSIKKMHEGRLRGCRDILEVVPLGSDLYIKYWTYNPQVLSSFEEIDRTGWYKANILSSFWLHSTTSWREEYGYSVFETLILKLNAWKQEKISVPKFKGELYPHQKEALQFLKTRHNALLAMDIGTGKTLVTLLHALRLFKYGKIDKAVIFANIAVKYVWEEQIKRFFGDKFFSRNIQWIDGTPAARARQWGSKKRFFIANYEQAKDEAFYKMAEKNRLLIVADECTNIKNMGTERTKRLMAVPAEYKMGLSGEPLERSMKEIHTIEKWLGTKIFGTYESFKQQYMAYKTRYKIEQALSSLHNYLSKTIMYRTTMRKVRPDMPKPLIIERPIEFSGQVLEDYNSIVSAIEKLEEELALVEQKITEKSLKITEDVEEELRKLRERRKKIAGMGGLLGYLKIVHRYCDHPILLSKKFSNSEMAQAAYKFFKVRHLSPKLDMTLKIIKEETDIRDKIIIFTEYEPMANIIADRIQIELHRPCMVMTGKSPPSRERGKYIEKFRTSKRYNILVMTDVGKFGLNFPYVNIGILYDLPWNSTWVKQRIGRLIRLEKTEQTKIYIPYVVNQGIIEQRVREKLNKKSYVISQVIDGMVMDTYTEWIERGGGPK